MTTETQDDATEYEPIETSISTWCDEMRDLAVDIKAYVGGTPDTIRVNDRANEIIVEWVDDGSPFKTMPGSVNPGELPAGVSVASVDFWNSSVRVTLDAPALEYIGPSTDLD